MRTSLELVKSTKTAQKRRSFVLQAHPGLGDLLVALPVAYALAEAGYNPALCMRTPGDFNQPMTYPRLNELSALPLQGETLPGKNPDVMLENDAWRWTGDGNMVTDKIAELSIEDVSTPRIACLMPPQESIAHYAQAYGRYVVCSVAGHFKAGIKALSAKQLAAVAKLCAKREYTLVITGEAVDDLPVPENSIDLRGQSNLRELVALVAGAAVAVVAESGPLHLAGAMRIPFLAIVPDETLPRGALCNYWPQITLSGKTAKAVPVSSIRRSLDQLLDMVETPWCVVGPDVNPCGVSETGRIMAKAAGVPYVPFEQHDGSLCVIEHHYVYMEQLHKYCKPENTILSLHRPEGIELDKWAGILFRSRIAEKQYDHQAKHASYVPLHSLYIADHPRQWSGKLQIMWHGIVHRHKGLEQIVEAWRIASERADKIELVLLCSAPASWGDTEMRAWLNDLNEPGLTVDIQPDRTREELHIELLQADCHIAFDSIDKEQSAVVPTVLGYGVPVVISKSTAFDDTRGRCITATPETLASEFVRLATDRQYYNDAAQRAWMGAQYRNVKLLAREYRAAVQASLLDK